MAYCTLDDLKEKISEDQLIQLTDDDDAGVIASSRTDRAIADAESEIDSYCAARYKVPLDPVPGAYSAQTDQSFRRKVTTRSALL